MATTPVLGLPYQTAADRPDGPNLGEDLALAIEPYLVDHRDRLAILDAKPRGLYKRLRRTTDRAIAHASGELEIMRIDDVPLTPGFAYIIRTSTLNVTPSAAGLACEARCRITTDGSTPTIASTLIGSAYTEMIGTFFPASSTVLETEYYPAAAGELLSVLLTASGVGGAGTSTYKGSVNRPISLYIYEFADPTSQGTIL